MAIAEWVINGFIDLDFVIFVLVNPRNFTAKRIDDVVFTNTIFDDNYYGPLFYSVAEIFV